MNQYKNGMSSMTSTDASLNLQWNDALQILYLDVRTNAIDKGIEIEWNEKIKRRMVIGDVLNVLNWCKLWDKW